MKLAVFIDESGKQRQNNIVLLKKFTSTAKQRDIHHFAFRHTIKMASADSHMRLQFLKESADFLKSQSPSISSHLMSVHNHLLREGFNPLTSSQKRAFCGACGSIRTSGQKSNNASGQKSIVKELYRKSQTLTAEEGSIYQCPRCHRRTFPATRKQKPLQKGRSSTSTNKALLTRPLPEPKDKEIPNPQPRETSTSSDPKTASSTATSSKKRAKARKQQGLQALVAAGKQVPQTSSSTSLDLFDFLQQ